MNLTTILSNLNNQMNQALEAGDMVKFQGIVDAIAKLDKDSKATETPAVEAIPALDTDSKAIETPATTEPEMFSRIIDAVSADVDFLMSTDADSLVDCMDQELLNTYDYAKDVIKKTAKSKMAKRGLKVAGYGFVAKVATTAVESIASSAGLDISLELVDNVADMAIGGGVAVAGSVLIKNAVFTDRKKTDWNLF
ncbi:MAG: hypothetical protein ACRCX2_01885 [Paraclostridium sp.]